MTRAGIDYNSFTFVPKLRVSYLSIRFLEIFSPVTLYICNVINNPFCDKISVLSKFGQCYSYLQCDELSPPLFFCLIVF